MNDAHRDYYRIMLSPDTQPYRYRIGNNILYFFSSRKYWATSTANEAIHGGHTLTWMEPVDDETIQRQTVSVRGYRKHGS